MILDLIKFDTVNLKQRNDSMTNNINDINRFFRGIAEKILKYRWLLLVLLVVVDILAVIGLQRVRSNNSWDTWFLEDDPITIATNEFEEVFGNNDYVGILVQADDVFAPEILQMIRGLGKDLLDQVPFSTDVTSLAEFEFTRGTEEGINIDNLVPDPVPTDAAEIERIRRLAFSKENLVNRLFTEDSRQTWIMLRMHDYPDGFEKENGRDPAMDVGEAVEKIIRGEKYAAYNLKHVGMPRVTYSKSVYFQKEAARVIGLAMLMALIVLIIILRSVRGVLVPLIITISALITTYGAMGFLGVAIEMQMMTIPVYLGLAISIGYSIHIINFFKRRFAETGKRRDAVLYAVEQTGWPLFFTALTTIGAMLSFNMVKITGVNWVGNASASIAGVVFIFIMILTPALLSFGKDREPKTTKNTENTTRTDKYFEALGNWVLRRRKAIGLFLILAVIFFAVGLTKTKITFDPFKTFGTKIPYVKEMYDVSRSPIGSIYSYEVTIEFPEEGQAKLPRNLRQFEIFEKKIKALKLTKRTSSVMDILKDMNRTLHADQEIYYKLPESDDLTAQLLLMYEMSGGSQAEKWLDYEYKRLRLMVEIHTFDSDELEKEIEFIYATTAELFPGAEIGLVGTAIQGAQISNYIARGQLYSFLLALAIIGILMMLAFRSVKTGLIGMIPNLTPVIVIGGLMGYLGLGLDMGNMMIIPMLMGIAVDDTIHFINHVKLEVVNRGVYKEAILHTFRTVGKALFMTTFILLATFAMYLTSEANIFINLGMLVCIGLLSALIADYTMMPILLNWAQPFGEERTVVNQEGIIAEQAAAVLGN